MHVAESFPVLYFPSLGRFMVYIKQPRMEVSSLRDILSPFVSTVWGVVVLTVIILALMLSATWHVTAKHSVEADHAPYSLWESWLYVFGAFCQQGVRRGHSPQMLSSGLWRRVFGGTHDLRLQGGCLVFRNVCNHLQDYTTLQSRRSQSTFWSRGSLKSYNLLSDI